ncbi:MAG: helix-turn-helix domain-containing protein [Actinomycetia bacterium]|nr:helix-turn-helix domain-containing protein [Actinomycetes bacterium]
MRDGAADSARPASHESLFAQQLREREPELVEELLAILQRDVPHLVGPDPRLYELIGHALSSSLESLGAAIAYQIPLDTVFVPPAIVEHARLLAQRDVSAEELLRGYQTVQQYVSHGVIRYAAQSARESNDFAQTAETLLGYVFAQIDASLKAAIAEHAETRGVWIRSRAAGVSKRLDAVLDGTVQDSEVAQRMLGYHMSGCHTAVIAWRDEFAAPPLDLDSELRRLKDMPGVCDALMVPRDERTFALWVNAPDTSRADEWVDHLTREIADSRTRVAVGEPAEGLEGFRLSHRQAQAAAGVHALAQGRTPPLIRYADVSAIAFLVDQPAEAKSWVEAVLGDLAGPGEDRERLRQTLRVYLDENGSAALTSKRLFIHRNTVRYRVEQACSMLPRPLEGHRLDVALALAYCMWIPVWESRA